jgi:hypothetical protein
MSLAARVEGARLNTPKMTVLTLDIERLPGTFTADFWDLNAFKNRRIHPDTVIEWPRTVCAAWRFYGSAKTEFASVWGDGTEGMLRRVWEAYDQADVLYGHNVDRFDSRKLNSEWRDLGLPPPSPYKVVDTLKEARKTFGDESNTLAALTERLGIDTKTDKYDVTVARAAVAGDPAAQRKIRAYNIGDIAASEALVDRLRGWIPSHPHNLMGTADDRVTCNQCWGDNLERNGLKLASVLTYVMWRCLDCGANVQGTRHSRAAITRGAR